MNFRTLIFTLIILICSCSGNKTVKLYQLQKDLAYDPEGGDGVGIVTDIKSITKSTLLKGTKISVTSQDVESAVSGTERVVEVKILDGKFKGKQIYLGSIEDLDETLKLVE